MSEPIEPVDVDEAVDVDEPMPEETNEAEAQAEAEELELMDEVTAEADGDADGDAEEAVNQKVEEAVEQEAEETVVDEKTDAEEVAEEEAVVEEEVEEEKPPAGPSRDVGEQRVKLLEERLGALENHNNDFKRLLADSVNRNSMFKQELQQQKVLVNEQTSLIRELRFENTRLKSDSETLGQRAEVAERLAADFKLQNERLTQQLAVKKDELAAAKSTVAELRTSNIEVQDALNATRSRLVSAEKDAAKWLSQLNFLKQSKEFYSEIEANLIAERDRLSSRIIELESQLTGLTASFDSNAQQFAAERKNFDEVLQQKDAEIRTLQVDSEHLSGETQTLTDQLEQMAEEKRQLEAQLSESFGTAANEKNQVAVLREQFDAQMQEAQLRFAALEAERNQERAAAEVAFADKDRELDRLRAELEKQEEKIHRYAKMFNAENPEVIAPAAAKTSKLMKDATSLTELYAAHFGLVVELETKTAQLKEAEKTLMAARKIFMDKASRMKEHEEHLTHFQRENDVLSAQLAELRKDREEIVSKATSFESELRFTKETLEVLQRECQTITNNYNRLLLQVNTGSADPASNPEAFGSIQELQRQNLDFINKIQTMESEKEEAIRTSHNEQFEEMKRQLESTRHQLDALEIRNNHLTASLGETERQRDAFKKLHGELEKRMTEWLDPSRVLALRKDLEATLHRAEKAEEELRTVKEGFEQTQRHLESKVESREQIIQEHQATIASLRDALRGSKVAHQQALIVQTALNRDLTALRAENKAMEEKQRLLEQKNRELVEKADRVLEEQKSSRAARMDVKKELADVKNALRLATIELNALKEQSAGRESLTTLVTELQSAVERKTLLLELANSRNSAAQQAEREQLESSVKQLEAEKKAVEDQLKLEVLKLQEECGRLRGEHQLSQKEIEPLKVENRDLISQYESLSTAFVQCQKLLSDLQLQRVDEQMAIAEVERLRKQVDEVMEMAEFWQTKYEQQLIGQATLKADAEGGEGTIERCENPSHVALIQFVSECKRRLNESLSRNSTLLQQIGIHEVRLRQYAEDMRVAEELTSSQSERIAQLQVDGGELTKKFNELTAELANSKGASLLQTEEINSLSLELREFEEANRQLREDLQTETTQKNALEARLETLENEFRSKIDQLTEFKIVAEEEKKTVDEELTAAQQREADALEKLNEFRAQLEGLQAGTAELPAGDVLQRTIANLRAERVQETSLRFSLTAELRELRTKNAEDSEKLAALQSELKTTAQELQTRIQLLDEQKQQMGEVENLQSRVVQLEAEIVELKKQSGGWEAEQKRLQDEIAAKQAEVEGLKEQADRLESALRSTTEDHNNTKEELGKVKRVAINYRNKFNTAEEELKGLRQQTEQKSGAPSTITLSSSPASSSQSPKLDAPIGAANLQRELTQRAREVLRLSTENQKLSQQVQTLEAEANSLKSRIVDLEKENGEKQQELAAKIAELQTKTDELDAVKFRNQALQSAHDRVKRQLQEKTAELEALQAANTAGNPTA